MSRSTTAHPRLGIEHLQSIGVYNGRAISSQSIEKYPVVSPQVYLKNEGCPQVDTVSSTTSKVVAVVSKKASGKGGAQSNKKATTTCQNSSSSGDKNNCYWTYIVLENDRGSTSTSSTGRESCGASSAAKISISPTLKTADILSALNKVHGESTPECVRVAEVQKLDGSCNTHERQNWFMLKFTSPEARFLASRALGGKRISVGASVFRVAFPEMEGLKCESSQRLPQIGTAGWIKITPLHFKRDYLQSLYRANCKPGLYVAVIHEIPKWAVHSELESFLLSGVKANMPGLEGGALASCRILQPGIAVAAWKTAEARFLASRALSCRRMPSLTEIQFPRFHFD